MRGGQHPTVPQCQTRRNQSEINPEIEAYLQRSAQSISAAQELLRGGYYDFTASRAYYAVFYAASALLLNEQMDTSKHSGVISLINQYFVKTGRLDKQHGKNLGWLSELRNLGDYGVTGHVSKQDAEQAIRAAIDFL
ncbi:MAG: HEPN domain-containing protein [Gammaproteobacteria bacterium]|nr:HEPN domain-containing protein [Gammaproteobacteria bacterium]